MDVQFLTKGSVVEVSTAEEGFGCVWFEATVVSPPKSPKKKNPHKRKLCVEYKTLCSDDDLSVPLREFVDVDNVRPLPPVDDNCTRLFEVYDVVDAWYQDGWWTGVITRVFEGLRFLVTFHNPPDELQFLAPDLRLHVDWLHDTWVRPPKQKVPGLMFGEGKVVEVSINRKHNQYNQDVWYPATIVENHADSSFLVEYKVLKEGTNETEPRKVTVDCNHIRPSPPPLKDRCFDVLDKVDAFHELGWCSGLITKRLPDNRFGVFNQHTREGGDFDLADVRPQLNWRDGKWWLTSSQEEVNPCQEKCGGLVGNELNDISSGRTIRKCKTKVSLKGKKMKQKACISGSSRESNPSEILSNSPCTSKGVVAGTNLEATEFPSSRLIKNLTDHVDMDHEKSHGVVSSPRGKDTMKINMDLAENLEREGGAVTPPCTSPQQNTSASDKQNGGINCTSGSPPSKIPGDNMLIDLTSGNDPSAGDVPSDNPSRRTRAAKMLPKENHTLSSGRKRGQADEEGNNGFTKGDEHVELDSGGKKADIVFILGLECSKLSGSKAGKACLNNDEKCLQLDGDQKKQLNNLPEKDKESEAGKSSQKRKRGRPPKVSRANTNSEMEDSSDGTMAKTAEPICIAKEVTRTVQQEHGMSDDQPLSTWFEKMQTSASVNISTQGASTAMMVEQSIKLRQTREESNGLTTFTEDNKTAAVICEEADGRSPVLVDEPELPFVKCSSLWKAVESMEAFRKMPQKPHFRPLQQHKESLREGFAIACMVNFSSVVEKISMLKFDDSKEKINDILDSLKDLGSHGFGVQVLLDRITELESIKEDHNKLFEEVHVLNKQIESSKFEKLEYDKELVEVAKQIEELQCRKRKFEMLKEVTDDDMERLEGTLEDAEEAIKSARSRYEGLASGVL